MPSRRAYLVDSVLPVGEVHLIAGPSGSGKSTLMYGELIPTWSQGKELWGYASHPQPFVVVSLDRSIASIEDTLERLGNPKIPAVDGRGLTNIHQVIEVGRKLVPEARVFFIEALAAMAPSGKQADYGYTAKFLVEMGRIAEQKKLTFICTVHCPKQHRGENYEDQRQRVSGSVAWAAMTDTIIVVERQEPGNLANRFRTVSVLPRNAAEFTCQYLLDEKGCFHETDEITAIEVLELGISFLPKEFKLKELLAFGATAGVSERTIHRWVNTSSLIKKIAPGCYQRVTP